MPAKIVVTESKGGSRISLLGSSGKELLGSSVFSEPRAKGATLRALRGLLSDVVVEDHTLSTKPKAPAKAIAAETPRARRTSTTRPAAKAPTTAPAKAPAKATAKAAKPVPATTKQSPTKAAAATKTAAVKSRATRKAASAK